MRLEDVEPYRRVEPGGWAVAVSVSASVSASRIIAFSHIFFHIHHTSTVSIRIFRNTT